LEHGGEQGDEDLLALGPSEQELENDVESGVEGVHGLSVPWVGAVAVR
jgi:hypothetical protein